jgi:lipopolysaccharide export system protein LptA
LILIFVTAHLSLNALAQTSRQIELLNSNTMEYDKSIGGGAKRLIGNVRFKHMSATMNCDSAYFYDNNTLDAFGHILINQGDTLLLHGDLLHYDGNTKMALVRDNVKLIDKTSSLTLTTNNIEYNLIEKVAMYNTGGVINNGTDNLRSKLGYYYANKKMFHFRTNVEIKNPKYTILSDTMTYHTILHQTYFFGPTEIESKDNYIYCENGWYNTTRNVAQFQKNAYLSNKKGMSLEGDSLYYDRNKGFGKAFKNVTLRDTANAVTLLGNYGTYLQVPEAAMFTDRAQMIKVDNKGDSMFLHADTLRMKLDSIGLHREFWGFNNVRIFKSDIQGVCDTLHFSFADSAFHMDGRPALWSGGNQLTANKIKLVTSHKSLDKMFLFGSSFIISKEDSSFFNQIKGRDMVGYFVLNELSKIEVKGNSQTVFYPKDGDDMIGVNLAESTDLEIFIKEKKIKKVRFLIKPTATLYPMTQLPAKNDMILKGFKWLEKQRPLSREDIFRKI